MANSNQKPTSFSITQVTTTLKHRQAVKIFTYLACLTLAASAKPGACDTNETAANREYQIKAAYLLNLIKFIKWPQADSKDIERLTNICLLGRNPFGTHLERLNNVTANQSIIEVSYHHGQGDGHNIDNYAQHREGHDERHTNLSQCEIVFVGNNNVDQQVLLDRANTLTDHALTVGESDNFIDQGGMVGLVVDSNRIELHINLSEAKRSGFEVSGNLLEIAQKVK